MTQPKRIHIDPERRKAIVRRMRIASQDIRRLSDDLSKALREDARRHREALLEAADIMTDFGRRVLLMRAELRALAKEAHNDN